MKINLSTTAERKDYLERLIKNYEDFEGVMAQNQQILNALLENDHVDDIVSLLAKTSDKLNNLINYHNGQVENLIKSGKTAIQFNRTH